MNRRMRYEKFVVYGVLILFAFVMLFPFYWMVVSSLKSGYEIVQRPPTIIPTQPTLDNYVEVLRHVPVGRYLLNSVIMAVCCLLASMYTTIAGAFALSKLPFRFKNLLLGVLLGLMMVPYESLVVTNYTTIVRIGLNDSIVALFLPFMSSIFYVLLLKGCFDNVPDSLYHSVIIDGGSDWRYLWRILVPSMKPILISIALFNLISSWNSFMWPLLIIKSRENRTITFGIYAFINEGGEHFEIMMAFSVIVIFPMVVVFFTMRRYLLHGVSMVGGKG